MNEYILGFDIGGTKCAVILARVMGDEVEILERRSFPTEVRTGPEPVLINLENTARSVLETSGLAISDVRSIGICCGGPLDTGRGIVLSPPNLPGWDNVHIVDRFESVFRIPVRLQNDANACAVAEWRWGAGRGTRNMVFLTFGTGLGSGLILDGRLYTGTNDMAGEAGHLRLAEDGPEGYGKRGSFEGFCSGGGIARLARDVARSLVRQGTPPSFCRTEHDVEHLQTHAVAEAARGGDPVALAIFQDAGRWLGRGLAMLIDILNPEVIVIGSIFLRQHDLLWPAAERAIAEEALSASARVCRVVPAGLGEAVGDYASLSVALD